MSPYMEGACWSPTSPVLKVWLVFSLGPLGNGGTFRHGASWEVLGHWKHVLERDCGELSSFLHVLNRSGWLLPIHSQNDRWLCPCGTPLHNLQETESLRESPSSKASLAVFITLHRAHVILAASLAA